MNWIAVIIAYNPDKQTVFNIVNNSRLLKRCIVIDNSENSNLEKFKGENIEYIPLFSNKGIGYALNVGINYIISSDIEWVITMDQDSSIDTEFLIKAEELVNKFPEKKIAIFSPIHLKEGETIESDVKSGQVKETDAVMMSGNLLNLKAYKELGPFNEKLFIDYVDIEYCLRALKKHYKIYISHELTINHSLGTSKWVRLGNLILKPTHHNKVRRYYISRNRLIVFKSYYKYFPKFFLIDFLRFLKENSYIILFEEDKFGKLIYTLKGIRDGILSKSGVIR